MEELTSFLVKVEKTQDGYTARRVPTPEGICDNDELFDYTIEQEELEFCNNGTEEIYVLESYADCCPVDVHVFPNRQWLEDEVDAEILRELLESGEYIEYSNDADVDDYVLKLFTVPIR